MDKERRMIFFCLLLAVICSPVFTEEWKAKVVKNLDALVSSCVVMPCSFTYPEKTLPSSKLRGIWHVDKKQDDRVYHMDQTRILENFRGRTRLLGNLGQNNCSLEITEIKDHDNGPYCFRIELAENEDPTINKFSFVEDCTALNMLPDPPKPTLLHSMTATQGHPYSITCSVIHTCPSHAPQLTWSRGAADEIFENHRELNPGNWEAASILTFIAQEKDDDQEYTCTAKFNGQKTSSVTLKLNVKRENISFFSYNHIIIPCAVGIGTAVIFAVVCIVLTKYLLTLTKKQNTCYSPLSCSRCSSF
uniref:Ig-like domain-containing protein n=1 Tax=Anabas testudineus TaxID=64144 RepID=A0A3Q1JIE5_ANATE